MGGDVETIRALLKGETGKGCKTAEPLLLSEGGEEGTLVLFTMPGKTLVLFEGNVEGGEKEEGFALLMLVGECVGEVVTTLLILGGELVGLS